MIVGVFLFFLSKQLLLIYSLNDKKNIPVKRDLVEQITQQREIINTIKSSPQKLFTDYYVQVKGPMDTKLREMCYRQVIHILKNKPSCSLEELDVASLKELDAHYEKIIQGILKVQDKVNEIEEKRLTTLSSLSPDKSGWMRYTSRINTFSVDYPKSMSIGRETDEYIMIEKNGGSRDSFLSIQKGYVYNWDKDLYPQLKTMKVNETRENTGCKEPSFDSFCSFKRMPDEYVNGQLMKLFVSEKIADYPNTIKLFLYIYEKGPGYMISLETNEKSTSKTNISFAEGKDILGTMQFIE